MGIVVSIMVGGVIWLITWAFGLKGVDGFLFMGIIVLGAATAHLFVPYLPGNRSAKDEPPDPEPFT